VVLVVGRVMLSLQNVLVIDEDARTRERVHNLHIHQWVDPVLLAQAVKVREVLLLVHQRHKLEASVH
jgi:hypothetical protein